MIHLAERFRALLVGAAAVLGFEGLAQWHASQLITLAVVVLWVVMTFVTWLIRHQQKPAVEHHDLVEDEDTTQRLGLGGPPKLEHGSSTTGVPSR